MSQISQGGYSEIADQQLDALESGSDADLYNAILKNCELIFRNPAEARSFSTAINTEAKGIIFRLPVPGYPPYKIFWSISGPRIEAVIPYPLG